MKVKVVNMKRGFDKSFMSFHVKHFMKRFRYQEANFKN